MKLLLDKIDLDFLLAHLGHISQLKALSQAEADGEFLAKGMYPTGKLLLALTEKDAEDIQYALAVLLSEKGIGDDGEPNSFGVRVDALIDQFSPDK